VRDVRALVRCRYGRRAKLNGVIDLGARGLRLRAAIRGGTRPRPCANWTSSTSGSTRGRVSAWWLPASTHQGWDVQLTRLSPGTICLDLNTISAHAPQARA
jgi:hypothetical protein